MTSRKLKKANLEGQISRMIDFYESGETLEETGEKFGGISKERVHQIFEEIGFKRRKQTVSDKFIQGRKVSGAKLQKNLPRTELENMYLKEKQSAEKIARFFDCSVSRVRNNLIRYRISIRSHNESMQTLMKSPELNEEVLRQLYIIENKSAPEIAAKYVCAQITIKRRLKEIGIRKSLRRK